MHAFILHAHTRPEQAEAFEQLFQAYVEPSRAEPGCIQGSETFVVMRSHNRWLSVPKGVWEEDAADPRARGRRAEA